MDKNVAGFGDTVKSLALYLVILGIGFVARPYLGPALAQALAADTVQAAEMPAPVQAAEVPASPLPAR